MSNESTVTRTRFACSRAIDPLVRCIWATIWAPCETGEITGRDPAAVADEIGDGGAAELKRQAVEVINEELAPLRRRRAELLADPVQLDGVLLDGIAAATAVAGDTLARVRSAMGMDYLR